MLTEHRCPRRSNSCAPQQVDREVYHGNKGEEIVLPDPL